MDKFLKEFRAGNSTLRLGGSITTVDEMGRPTYHNVGLLWDPRDCETGRTVAAKNHLSIKGDPGDKVSIKVFLVSLKDHQAIEELKPTFTNAREEIWVWEHEKPFAVFISGERDSESWTISHWRMFSGRVDFDLAKNKIRLEAFKGPETTSNGDDGHKPSDELDSTTKDAIAGAELDGTLGTNKVRESEPKSDPERKPRNGKRSKPQDKGEPMPDVKGMSLKDVEEAEEAASTAS